MTMAASRYDAVDINRTGAAATAASNPGAYGSPLSNATSAEVSSTIR